MPPAQDTTAMPMHQQPPVLWPLPDPALELPSPLPVDGGGQAPYPTASADVLTASWDGRLALAVSQLASPPVLGAATLLAAAAALGGAAAWFWSALYVVLAVLAPMAQLVLLLRRGEIGDLHVKTRGERPKPMLFTAACGGLAYLALALGGAPPLLSALAAALWVLGLALLGITLAWKISVHCAVGAGFALLLWFLHGTPLPLLIGVPLLAWARLRLRRHTVAQTLAGTLLGLLVIGAALAVLPGS